MLAATVAAGMLLAPAPASAKLTFGRAADVAEQQVQLADGKGLTRSKWALCTLHTGNMVGCNACHTRYHHACGCTPPCGNGSSVAQCEADPHNRRSSLRP
jgi:hypothetical protein